MHVFHIVPHRMIPVQSWTKAYRLLVWCTVCSSLWQPAFQLQSVTYHKGLRIVTCHLTQVNTYPSGQ